MRVSRTLLLIGSSIMEQWKRPSVLAPAPHWRVVNRAVSGTTTAYWVENLPSVLADEMPSAVLVYAGSNDFAQGVSAEAIAANLRACRAHVRLASPEVRFGYVAIIKAPQRLGKFDGIAAANQAARAALDPGDFWFDTDPVFLTSDGSPVAGHYVEDGLHLTPAAYDAFAAALVPRVQAWLAPL